MNDRQLSALVAAARSGGVERDGLRADRTGEGFVFETPDRSRDGLDEDGFREAAARRPRYVSNWYFWEALDRPAADRAFLRWLEGADDRTVPERYEALDEGVTRTWGQLAATAGLGDHGRRTYRVRHEADADAPLSELSVRADPLEARELVTYDERGGYRPLKTAPTLRTGWAFADLDGRALTRLVDVVYPATVANWHREREGDLDVSHYRETMARQTGIYDVVDELPPEAVERVAEACCVDSQCLRRRQWDEDEDTPLAVPRGDGEFPCREPCSLVVAAARTWTLAEREAPREYTFELTPTEKEQVEAILDAVAEGRTDEIREADFEDGANRYRARYLRAKRMCDGDLCGVPTDPEDEGADAATGGEADPETRSDSD